MLAGAGLAVFLTWFFARSLRVDIPWLPDSRRGGVAVLGVVLPLFTSAMITGLHVARLRFDLVPTALVTILAGLGVAGVVSLVFHRRIIASVVFTALIASALIPLPHLWRPYADPMEHHFLLNEVVPVLATQDPRPRLVFPKEAEKSKSVPTEWWDSYLPAVQVVPDLSDLEDADDARALYAVIGYTCSWSHGRWEGDRWLDEEGVSWASPPPYPQAEHIEGEPRIHPRCAAALAGHRWRTIATRKIPLFGMEGNNTRVHPGLEEVTIGLYQADSAGESIHTP